LAVLATLTVVFIPTAAPDKRPPRIVAAVMVDLNGNARADRVRLTYSERIRHVRDHDGKYTFTVTGYRVLSVGAASGRSLVILLRERATVDTRAHPTVRYRRTAAQPVRDLAGNQALTQLFGRTRPHGHLPPMTTPTPTPTPAPTPTPTPTPTPVKDSDGDGYDDQHDCAPTNAAIHPGAPDLPDLSFVDSNCDGIDGTIGDAVFVSPLGSDMNPGTKSQPKREIQAAVVAAGTTRYVLVAFGTYGRVILTAGIQIYGGYDAATWQRRDQYPDGVAVAVGTPEGLLVDGANDVLIQHLAFRGVSSAGQLSAYGMRVINGASVRLQRAVATSGDGAPGAAGGGGPAGRAGGPGGGLGHAGPYCDSDESFGNGYDLAASGGSSPAGRSGGKGGNGGYSSSAGEAGHPGIFAAGGAGGASGNPGHPGAKGDAGENGTPGGPGLGGSSSVAAAGATWTGQGGSTGALGGPGNGGGGGGGGGGQHATFVIDGTGNPGGGGGGGGAGGEAGAGGTAGGGSFGIYLYNSVLVGESVAVAAGNGGVGGAGGDGGFGGAGGVGSKGDTDCTSQVGAGGDGGNGGAGGRGGGGGGGAGGPSIGIFKIGSSSLTLDSASTFKFGSGGSGGVGGSGGPGGTGGAGAGGSALGLAQA
jgi:hypothetical protein